MKRNAEKTIIAVSGSLAYDRIMDFPGVFSDHILPDQIHNLNISFLVANQRRGFGGTAGNIAYNLALLKAKPAVLSTAGSDFPEYRRWLKRSGVGLGAVAETESALTAAAYIITDQKDNQITSFCPGPMIKGYARRALTSLVGKISLAIIAADDKARMLEYAAYYQTKKIPYIFDPGQAVIAFSGAELQRAVKGAKVLIGNDYEISLILDRLATGKADLGRMVEILVVTKGAAGSEIYRGNEKIVVRAARPKNTCDPTGAGDAYRAGFIKGLLAGCDLKTCGQLAGLVAAYTVEKFGTQTHRFTMKELADRYQKNFREKLVI